MEEITKSEIRLRAEVEADRYWGCLTSGIEKAAAVDPMLRPIVRNAYVEGFIRAHMIPLAVVTGTEIGNA